MPLFSENQETNNNQPTKGLFSLPPALMQLVPWIPLLLEQTTGQKIPQMTGTIAEIHFALSQIQAGLQTLDRKLTSLETNANQQFTNLVQQVQSIQSLRLTHERERKQIDYNLQPKNKSQEY